MLAMKNDLAYITSIVITTVKSLLLKALAAGGIKRFFPSSPTVGLSKLDCLPNIDISSVETGFLLTSLIKI